MKKYLSILLLALLGTWAAGCGSSGDEPGTGGGTGGGESTIGLQSTQTGSAFFTLEGYKSPTLGLKGLQLSRFKGNPLYVQSGKFSGTSFVFAPAAAKRLDAMTTPPSSNWSATVDAVDGNTYWVSHTASDSVRYMKIRVAEIANNSLTIEYIGAGGYIVNGETPIDGNDFTNSNDGAGYSYATDLCMPHLNADNYYVEHTVTMSGNTVFNYALEWNAAKKHSAWVAFTYDATTRPLAVTRTNAWAVDPSLPAGMQVDESYHKSDGYDKGHLVASNDRRYSTEANEQTFYYSNMSPQLHSFNEGFWGSFEDKVAEWGRSSAFDKVYVVKGGTLNQLLTNFTGTQNGNDGVLPTTNANGLTKHGLACPKYYFIAVLAEKSGSYQAVGFLVEHRDDYGYTMNSKAPAAKLKECAMSIDKLEEATGIDFFCNLPGETEASVESTYNESDWNW